MGLRVRKRSFKRCGEIYRRVHWNNRGCRSIVWRCVSRLEEKGSDCCSQTVNEEILQNAVVKAINEALCNKNTFLEALQANIAAVLNEQDDKGVDAIESKLFELQRELLSQANSKNDYNDLAREIHRLRDLKQDAQVQNAERQGKKQRIEEMVQFLKEQTSELLEFDDQLVRRVIEKITVFDSKLIIEFKSCVETEIEIYVV